MNKKQAWAEGYNHGYEAATYCEVDTDGLSPTEYKEKVREEAYEAEENGRQYSPFEFLAHDLNESEDRADGLWEAYYEGVVAGIDAGVKERMKDLPLWFKKV